MDLLSQSQLQFSELDQYVERHDLFRLFEYILEKIIIDRPEDPIDYLHRLLMKGFFDALQVFLLGAPTIDRKVAASTLHLKLQIVHLTTDSLFEHADSEFRELLDRYETADEVPASLWADIIKRRIEKTDCVRKGFVIEGFPRTREQAFCMVKKGIFPSHVVALIEPEANGEAGTCGNFEMYSEEEISEIKNFRFQVPMIVDFLSRNNVRCFYLDEDLADLVDSIVNFVMDKESAFVPYCPRVLLFGPPGSGKRTISTKLASKYPLAKINYDEVLHGAIMSDGPFKEELEEALCTDEPVSDILLARVIADRLTQDDCLENGWIMVNFPFNVNQAEELTKCLEGFQVNKAIFLENDLDVSIFRLAPRRLDSETGEFYHLIKKPPPMGIEERLLQRNEDTEDKIRESFMVYEAQSVALQGYYSRALPEDIVFYVDSNDDDLESVFENVESLILGSSRRRPPPQPWWARSSRNSGIY